MARWSREECEKRYIEGDLITLKGLAEISGVPYDTLRKWANKDDWREQRDRYQVELTSQTRQKTIEKVSDRVSDELSARSLEQLEAYTLCRRIGVLKAQFILKALEQRLAAHPEVSADEAKQEEQRQQATAVSKVDVAMLNFLTLAIDRAVRGERMVAGQEHELLNHAIATIERTGLKVSVPDDQILAQLIVGQARSEDRSRELSTESSAAV